MSLSLNNNKEKHKEIQITNPIILFDGICNFCNSSINFLIKIDKKKIFRFAPLQSETGNNLLTKNLLKTNNFDSFILIKNNKVYQKSDAIIEIAKFLKFPYNIFVIFKILPKSILNYFYDLIAKNRYKIFGHREKCMIPNDDVLSRFL